MNHFEDMLRGGDLRSIGQSNQVVALVHSRQDFNRLFACLFHTDRKVVMRAADAIEKITLTHPEYLQPHKNKVLTLCRDAGHIELKWHLSLLVARLTLNKKETENICRVLAEWATHKKESRIVRVNAFQALFEIAKTNKTVQVILEKCIALVEKENIPSLNARIRKLESLCNKGKRLY